MRLGIAHHLGWAVAVAVAVSVPASSADYRVVDRRRIELIEDGLPNAPVHHEGGLHPLHRTAGPGAGASLDDDALAALIARVRASAVRTAAAALGELAHVLPEPITSISVRAWPDDFPRDIATQRRAPYESRADSIMYCQVLAEVARSRDWAVHLYDAKDVEATAVRILDTRAHDVLHGPRAVLGPPWSKDHRIALAATIVAAHRQGA